LKSLGPTDFATNTRQPPPQDIAGDKEEVHSSGNKEDTAVDMEDSARKGKEKVADLPKSIKKQGGSKKPRGESQDRVELETPSEATATISMPKSK
jgi:hypothetical protein